MFKIGNIGGGLFNTALVIFMGTMISLIMILVVYYTLPSGALEVNENVMCGVNDMFNGVSRKWDGTCAGWTNEMARSYVYHNLKFFLAYNIISVMILARHPIQWNKPWSVGATFLSAAFVFTCGLAHLFDVYTVFNPIYEIQIAYLFGSSWVSIIASAFVVYGLETNNRHMEKKRENDKIEEEQTRKHEELIRQNEVVNNARKKINYLGVKATDGIPDIKIDDIPLNMSNFLLKKDMWGLVKFPESIDCTSLVYDFKDGSSFGWHRHDNTETIMCVGGKLEVLMYVEDEIVSVVLDKNQCVEIPAGIDHDAVAVADNTRILVMFTPKFPGGGWYANKGKLSN